MSRRVSTQAAVRARVSPATTMVVVCLATTMLMVDLALAAVALRSIAVDLGAGLDDLQWVLVGYSATMGSLILLAASLSDRIGRRRVFGGGLVVFTVASALCAAAPNALSLNVFRVVHGVGAALLFAPVVPLLHAAYPPERRQRAVGLWSAVAGLAGLCGPLLGGLLIDAVGWRAVFWINVPIGLLVLVLLRRLPADGPITAGRPDLFGAVLLVTGLLSINLSLTLGVDGGIGPGVVAGVSAGLLVLAAFVVWSVRRPDPLVDPRLLRQRRFAGIAAVAFLSRAGSVGLLVFLMVYLQWGRGLGSAGTAVALLPLFLGMLPGSLLAPRLLERRSVAAVSGVGAGLAAVGCLSCAALLLLTDGGVSLVVLGIGLALMGFGGGLVQTPLPVLAASAAPPDRVGMTTGTVNSLLPIGTGAGAALLGLAFVPAAESALGQASDRSRSELLAGLSAVEPSLVTTALGRALAVVLVGAAVFMAFAAVIAASTFDRRRPLGGASASTPTTTEN